MSTNQETPAVNAAEITEADFLAFYRAKDAEIITHLGPLCESMGFDKPRFGIRHFGEPFEVCSWKSATYVSGYGETVAGAEADFVKKMNARLPDPAKLRAEADALLAEAAKIEAAKGINTEAAK
jgi:hypothetical protein